MPKTYGSKDKVPGSRKSRAGADQARARERAAKSAGGANIREAFARGSAAAALAPAPAPEMIAPVTGGSSDTGDVEAAVPPPPVTNDANDACDVEAGASVQEVTCYSNSVPASDASAEPVSDDPFAASARRATVASAISTSDDVPAFNRGGGAPNAPAAKMQQPPSMVKIKLTRAIREQIFTEMPSVRRTYLDAVPGKMSEKEFWMRYFRAKTRSQMPAAPGGSMPAARGASAAVGAGTSATATASVNGEEGATRSGTDGLTRSGVAPSPGVAPDAETEEEQQEVEAELDEHEDEEEDELYYGAAAAPNDGAAQDGGGGDASDVSGATTDGDAEIEMDDENPMRVLLAAVVQRLQVELKTTGVATHNWLLAHLKQNDFWLLTAHLAWVRRTPHPQSCPLHLPRTHTTDGSTTHHNQWTRQRALTGLDPSDRLTGPRPSSRSAPNWVCAQMCLLPT